MHYNSVLSLSHFSDSDFRKDAIEIFRHFAAIYPGFPEGRENAKIWETIQAWRAFRDLGVLGDGAEVLGVGAGFEPLVFWLTNHVRRVFATDLYETNTEWKEAVTTMLTDPAALCPELMPFNERRLAVQYMNALDLKYEDNSFDGIFSCGSIEHFGSLDNVTKASAEMGRVLKPGGILSLSTEFRISGPEGIGIPGAILFTPELIEQTIVKPSGLQWVDELDPIDDSVLEYAYPLLDAIEHGTRPRSICLTHAGYTWTSVSIALRKP